MRVRVAFLLSGLMALPTAAMAADGDTRATANAYSSMLERQFFEWHIWTTGVSRLDDGTLFGLASIILALAFGCSGLGIILFKESGLRFRGGWMLSLPIIVASLIIYTMFRPYPTARDAPSMLLSAILASLVALAIARAAKGSATQAIETPVKKVDPDKPIDDRRLKMAVRAPGGPRRAF